MPDDDDRPRDASSAADRGWGGAGPHNGGLAGDNWADAVAPDDISELARDIQAYHREQRAVRRREVMRRICSRRSTRGLSLSVTALAILALVAAGLTLMAPGHSQASRLPLARSTTAVGQVPNVVPAVALKDLRGNTVPAQSLRPAVLALIPRGWGDASLLSELAGDASTAQLPLVVVAPSATDPAAAALGGRIDRGTSSVYYDASGTLATDFTASGVTLVLLDRDGTVFKVVRNVASEASSDLAPLLQQMLQRTTD